jgi:hypothetical protein
MKQYDAIRNYHITAHMLTIFMSPIGLIPI